MLAGLVLQPPTSIVNVESCYYVLQKLKLVAIEGLKDITFYYYF